jgi:lysine-N-methylase
MDQPHYERLRMEMDHSPEERERFRRLVKKTPAGNPSDPERFAVIQFKEDGQCGFLDHDRLCSVHRNYGEGFLGNMCAIYPRDIALVDDRVEVTATLSCPEAARQCLLATDAMEMEDYDASLLPRLHLFRRLQPHPADSYFGSFDFVREEMLKLLSATRFPLASRLFFTAYLAHRTVSYFGRDAESPVDRLAEECARLEGRGILDELHHQFHAVSIPAAWALEMIQVILQARLQIHIPEFHQLVVDALSSHLGPANALAGDPETISIPREKVWTQYQQRRAYWTQILGWRIDQMFGNYCENYWLRDWYVTSENLLVHAQRLLVRLAILRFLLFSHPRLRIEQDQPSLGPADMEAHRTALEETTVEVSHKVLRALEHDPSFLERVQQALQAEGAHSLAHLMFLLKF